MRNNKASNSLGCTHKINAFITSNTLMCIHHITHIWQQYRQRESTRLILKHLRQYGQMEEHNHLMRTTKVRLESPLVSELYRLVVDEANFSAAERTVESAASGECSNAVALFVCSCL